MQSTQSTGDHLLNTWYLILKHLIMRIDQELDRLVNGFLPSTFCPWNSVEPSWLSCTSCIYLLQIHVHYVLCMDIRHFRHQTLCWHLLNGLWRSEHALREGWYNWAITMLVNNVKGWRDGSFSRFSPGFILVNFKFNWFLESSGVQSPLFVDSLSEIRLSSGGGRLQLSREGGWEI